MNVPLINLGRLRSLEQELSVDDARALVATFLENTRPMISDLGSALTSGASAEAARIAHRVKGGALAIGADALADLTGRIESGAEVAGSQVTALWEQTVQALRFD